MQHSIASYLSFSPITPTVRTIGSLWLTIVPLSKFTSILSRQCQSWPKATWRCQVVLQGVSPCWDNVTWPLFMPKNCHLMWWVNVDYLGKQWGCVLMTKNVADAIWCSKHELSPDWHCSPTTYSQLQCRPPVFSHQGQFSEYKTTLCSNGCSHIPTASWLIICSVLT